MMRLIEMVVERVEAWFRYSSAAFSSVNITGTYKLYWASHIWCAILVGLVMEMMEHGSDSRVFFCKITGTYKLYWASHIWCPRLVG